MGPAYDGVMEATHDRSAVGGGGAVIVRTSRFDATLAVASGDVREAQRLRYRVFAEELGARFPETLGALDADPLDEFCDHLLVRERASGAVVGTYRMLSPAQARRAGRLSADGEFDLRLLRGLRASMVEVGRACVDPEFRNGAVIALLWAALMRYLRASAARWVVGCASVPLVDGHAAAASVCERLCRQHLGPDRWRVFPRRRFPVEAWPAQTCGTVPPLIKGYLRLGAWVCGEAAWDEDFNTADLLLLLPLKRLDRRHARWLERLGSAGTLAHDDRSADAA